MSGFILACFISLQLHLKSCNNIRRNHSVCTVIWIPPLPGVCSGEGVNCPPLTRSTICWGPPWAECHKTAGGPILEVPWTLPEWNMDYSGLPLWLYCMIVSCVCTVKIKCVWHHCCFCFLRRATCGTFFWGWIRISFSSPQRHRKWIHPTSLVKKGKEKENRRKSDNAEEEKDEKAKMQICETFVLGMVRWLEDKREREDGWGGKRMNDFFRLKLRRLGNQNSQIMEQQREREGLLIGGW